MTTSRKRPRRYIETGEYMKAMARLIRGAGRRVGTEDSDDLADLFELERELDSTIVRAVALLRAQGNTWQAIGDAAGTTRQAAQMRFGPKVSELEAKAQAS